MNKMSKEEYQEVYDNLKNNSIGNEKRCSNNRTKRNVALRIALPVLVGTLTAAALVGCSKETVFDFVIPMEQEYDNSYEDYDLTSGEISIFGRLRLEKLLNDNGLIDYSTTDDNLRNYSYTVEDYKEIKELDETYLYDFYTLTTEDTVNEVAKALGYENLDDYLEKNDFMKKNGKRNLLKWSNYHTNTLAKIIVELDSQKGLSK